MNNSRFEAKVGFFVFFGLVVAALLVLNFSKGITLFRSTYKLHLIMPTVAGLKPAADVMLAGVPIGKVVTTSLSLDGRSVDITLLILSKYKIRDDAKFHIDALGFLGDQYIEVTPAEEGAAANAAGGILKDGDKIMGDAPFNMQEAVRSVSGLLEQARKTIKDVDQAVTNVNHTVLAEASLEKFSGAMSNFEAVTTSANTMAGEVREILDSNAAPVNAAITNFVDFSEKLNRVTDQLGQTISTNSGDVTEAVKNFRETSVALKQLADGLNSGQGVAGALLKDESMKEELSALLTNANAMSEQFGLFALHLNQRGIFRMMLKPPKSADTNSTGR